MRDTGRTPKRPGNTPAIARFDRDDSGATAIEYGVIAALIALVIVVSARLIGTELAAIFEAVTDGF